MAFIEKNEFGGIYFNFTENTFAYFENDWKQLFGKYNWKTYRFADIYYEDDIMLGGKEFRFVLLGLGFCIRYDNPHNEKMKELSSIADKISSRKEK